MSAYYKCDYCLKEIDIGDMIRTGVYSSLIPRQDICFDCWINPVNWADIHQPKYREQNPEYFKIHQPNRLKRVVSA